MKALHKLFYANEFGCATPMLVMRQTQVELAKYYQRSLDFGLWEKCVTLLRLAYPLPQRRGSRRGAAWWPRANRGTIAKLATSAGRARAVVRSPDGRVDGERDGGKARKK